MDKILLAEDQGNDHFKGLGFSWKNRSLYMTMNNTESGILRIKPIMGVQGLGFGCTKRMFNFFILEDNSWHFFSFENP